ncbi:TetR/AcrR family transcriptional regulator [Thiohalobacter thiocyanaticus]|uniref:TetR/AcrR family transcriptional regulator n=1 Tax=Thiohalobacter thiocyanaticus TaxID=585455 RepID=A0A426QIH7_9GAMM|nr:TetR/AcrR family transcriptional regulator [Thiohalobacter thiocyanaticus]RRQ21559.1 TetR/AcrR family transcriptional regulator [Thiohalobacter thiocyanaticus]
MLDSIPDSTAGPRDRVLAAALELFAHRGYFSTSVPDIVRASGVSTGSVYHHFGDKEGIARTLYDSVIERMEQALEAIRERHPDTASRCRSMIELLFDIAEHDPDLMSFMLHARHREFLPAITPVCSSRPFQLMRGVVAEGMRRGEVRRMDETVAAVSVFGGALRLIQMRLDGALDRPLNDFLDDTWDCAWRAIASDAA